MATAKHGGDIQDKTVIKDVSFGIIKANLPSFEISPINLNGAFGYTSLTASLSNNLLAEANDYLGTITYSIVDQSEIGGRLSITDNNTLTLSSGLGVGTYNFTLRASASADINYNEA